VKHQRRCAAGSEYDEDALQWRVDERLLADAVLDVHCNPSQWWPAGAQCDEGLVYVRVWRTVRAAERTSLCAQQLWLILVG
jgi:hypothetical protein